MPTNPFSAEVRVGPDRTIAMIVLHGELNSTAEADLDQAFAQATAGPATAVTLEFTDVSFMNSTGIALIVQLLSEAQLDGRELRALGLNPHYREIFEITRLSDFIRIFEDEASAVARAVPTATATPATIGGEA
jgi:anti-sigma B factor antagonist